MLLSVGQASSFGMSKRPGVSKANKRRHMRRRIRNRKIVRELAAAHDGKVSAEVLARHAGWTLSHAYRVLKLMCSRGTLIKNDTDYPTTWSPCE